MSKARDILAIGSTTQFLQMQQNVLVTKCAFKYCKSRIFRTHSIFVSRALRPFARMTFSNSRQPLRVLRLALYLSHAFYFCAEAAAYKIYENNMRKKYSGFTVPISRFNEFSRAHCCCWLQDSDPFFEAPNQSVKIGSVHVYLQSITYLVSMVLVTTLMHRERERGELLCGILMRLWYSGSVETIIKGNGIEGTERERERERERELEGEREGGHGKRLCCIQLFRVFSNDICESSKQRYEMEQKFCRQKENRCPEAHHEADILVSAE